MKDAVLTLVSEAAGVSVSLANRFSEMDIDSLDFLLLIQDAEKLTGRQLTNEQVTRIETVQNMVDAFDSAS